ncbi:MAG: acyl-CoA dehydrogenase [bacterium]|nr:acyl-CoA dehydrogenase [bacterium]
MTDSTCQDKIINEVKSFTTEHIKPYVSKFEEDCALPEDLIAAMAEKGYLAAPFPKEYGGLGLDPVYYGLFTQEIGKVCSSTRALLTVHTSLVGETIVRWGTDKQKNELLPAMASGEKIAAFALSEPEIGSDAKSVRTAYRKEGSSYIINGKKKWITFGGRADMFLVIASNGSAITAFLIDREQEGVSTKAITGMLAGRASHIAEVEFNNVSVPEENILGREGGGFAYVASTALDHGRYSIAWAGTGIAQGALEAMVLYARSREQAGEKIYNYQLIQGMIGDAVTKVHAARALCLRAGEMRKNKEKNAVMETNMAKYFTSKIAMQVALDAVQVHGGNGCCTDFPVERFFREAKVLEIIEGTSQIQQIMIAQFGLREYYTEAP